MRIEGLCKAYGGEKVLQDLSAHFDSGVTVLMAPSGSGKTTLLRILLGLEQPDSGEIYDAPERWGVMFQEDGLLEGLTALEILRFAIGPTLEEEKAAALLKRLGIGAEGDKRVGAWSGGMKRRLALARALLCPAPALMLDEPFTGLDEENKAVCLAAIREAAREKMVLLVTHDASDVQALDAQVIRL